MTSAAMHALATAGAIEPLVQKLLEGTDEERGWAAQALCRFSSEQDQAVAGSALLTAPGHCVEGLLACLQHEEVRCVTEGRGGGHNCIVTVTVTVTVTVIELQL